MSGIVGLFYRNQQPVARNELAHMLDAIQHRGPDGSGLWCAGSVGLGHQMLHTTPESLHEQLPLQNRRGDLVITAHARIDNRAELIAALNLRDRPASTTPDSELILAAYEQWGERCPERLLGDFAFAIWDERNQTLFCARDHFGVKPFYYYLSEQLFAFGSEMKVITSLPQRPWQLNELRLADYLSNTFGDAVHTFYQDVLRLPPGHILVVERQQVRLRPYYDLSAVGTIRLRSDSEYAEAFRAIFTEAVRCRMRNDLPVGFTLSGGLDSSSVVCVARQLRAESNAGMLPAFSLVYDHVPECDERRYITPVLAGGGIDAHFLAGDDYGMLHELNQLLWHLDEPFHGQGLATSWPLYAAAHAQGMRVMLVGHDGDTAVSHGHGFLPELAYRGSWFTLAHEVRALLPAYPMPFWQAFAPLLWRHGIAPRLAQLPAPAALRLGWRGLRHKLHQRRQQTQKSVRPTSLLHPDFARRVGLDAYRRRVAATNPTAPPSERADHYESLSTPIQPLALENLDKLGAAHQIEVRYPFWDRRLIEFCLALPGEQKLHQGWGRVVMRRAMEGLLPPEVQWRRDKMDFTPSNVYSLRTHDRALLEELLLANPVELTEFLAVEPVQALCAAMLDSQQGVSVLEMITVLRIAILASWLQQHANTTQYPSASAPLTTLFSAQAVA